MSKIEELKINAGVENNPDQEGLNLFAEMIISEYKDRAKDFILKTTTTQPLSEKVEELKITAGLSDNPDQEGLTRFAQWVIVKSADAAELHLPEDLEAEISDPNGLIDIVNESINNYFSQ